MYYRSATIPLSDIDTGDDTFRITTSSSIGSLAKGIETVGLINPPVLLPVSNRYTVISGFRRVQALRRLGRSDAIARIVRDDSPGLHQASVAVAENALQRPLNLIEASRVINLLSSFIPEMARLSECAVSLGLAGDQQLFRKLMPLCHMPAAVQRGILAGAISLTMALALNAYEAPISTGFAEMFHHLKLSLNKQREVLTHVKEIALRENLAMAGVLESPDLLLILEDGDLDRARKARSLRAYLRKRRFPNLAAAESAFEDNLRGIGIGSGMRLVPPRNFEGTEYTLQMQFADTDQLEEQREALDRVIEHPKMRAILDR